jgi:hypothetical protein
LVVESREDGFTDASQLALLRWGQAIEHPTADFGGVSRCGLLEDLSALAGEGCVLTTAVFGAAETGRPALAFEARDGVGHPAGGEPQYRGQFVHPHGGVWGFGEDGQDGVVAVGHSRVVLELPLECLVEELEAQQECSPCRLLVAVQPTDVVT